MLPKPRQSSSQHDCNLYNYKETQCYLLRHDEGLWLSILALDEVLCSEAGDGHRTIMYYILSIYFDMDAIVMACVGTKDSLWDSIISFHYVGPGIELRSSGVVVSLMSSHFASPD